MLVTIEGPEAAGKSTLVDLIADRLQKPGGAGHHVVRVNCRRPNDDPFGFYLEMLKLACRPDVVVILDRAWPSEAVYGALLKRPSMYTPEYAEALLHPAARMLGPTLMVLPATADELVARRSERGAGFDHKVQPVNEYHEYKAYATAFGWDRVNGSSLEDAKRSALNVTIELHAAAERIANGVMPPAIVGDPYAKVVLVGEARNPRVEAKGQLAWAPFTSRGTRWLFNTVGAPFHRMLYTNAEDVTANPVIADVVRRCHTRLALGEVAQRTLFDAGMDHVELANPAGDVTGAPFVRHDAVRWPDGGA